MFGITFFRENRENKLELWSKGITYKVKRHLYPTSIITITELKQRNNFLFVHTEQQKSKLYIYTHNKLNREANLNLFYL